MERFEFDIDCEGCAADISLDEDEDRLVIDTSFEVSENGDLDQDDQINEDERDSVVGWKDDADHESNELESPASPDPETHSDSDADDEYEQNNQVRRPYLRYGDPKFICYDGNNNSEEMNQDPNHLDESDPDIYRRDVFYITKEINKSEDKDGVDDNSREEGFEASTEEPMASSELNMYSSDEEESVVVGRRQTGVFKAARKKLKLNPRERTPETGT
ncbi:Hypothetical predicted protein [Cloeon dipterum]|uniref:Uncharacterized protein n=1 Tax=Cloeon dipterum TaxID=197152 RepID=A0A8S1CRQ4_9INSE|nr:Hypothetical predicted protein [Cloeon dipterum]